MSRMLRCITIVALALVLTLALGPGAAHALPPAAPAAVAAPASVVRLAWRWLAALLGRGGPWVPAEAAGSAPSVAVSAAAVAAPAPKPGVTPSAGSAMDPDG